ncbi:pseudouridylate synthase [Bacteroidia bacterium]|nr:pseudouridylate synthase [Bacteroidia bacterium]MDB4107219.1 pseudouridylate synthase [Bacteroidia bacterium]MDC1395583.1 pseudouridylate synthase [Bacteroidia bacterium]
MEKSLEENRSAIFVVLKKLIAYNQDISNIPLPDSLNDPFEIANEPHPLSLLAVAQLQEHLSTQTEWQHNFGLQESAAGKPIGKMFGILVVQTTNGDLGFLAAFSGKLAGGNHHSYFVPPVFDSLSEDEFLNCGMRALKVINDEIRQIELAGCKATHQLMLLKEKRRAHSQQLQSQLFDAYKFSNAAGELRTPKDLFATPPAGAGECAAPKLLQYAYQQDLTPLVIAEFWWGAPPTSTTTSRIHGYFYPACEDKCRGVLRWMLG